MYDEFVTILENRRINGKYYRLTFRSKNLSRKILPGQFLNVQIEAALDPFLRRPFSYYRVKGDTIEVLYEILGRGTAILASKPKGHRLKAMGPLGKPFTRKISKKRVLVAGGVGVPPLVFLAEVWGADYFLIGAKSKQEVLPARELAKAKAAGGQLAYATNDGSYGKPGFVTVLLREILEKENPKNLFIQTCGPTPMMEAVLKISREYGAEGEASVEETMACGVGACLGCMVKTHDGWKPSCVEGPVFRFADVEHL